MTLFFRQTSALVVLAVVLVAAPLGAVFLCATCAETLCPDSAQPSQPVRALPSALAGAAATLGATAPPATHGLSTGAVAAPAPARLSYEHAVPLRI